MSKKIFCKKLKKDLSALTVPPMPGPKGIEIMNSILLLVNLFFNY